MIPKTSDKPICVQAMFSNNAKPQLFLIVMHVFECTSNFGQ